MRLPLVPRGTLDALVRANDALAAHQCSLMSERDWLRSQLATALDHNRRLERKEVGLTEKPREPKERESIPANITKIISAFGSAMTQEDQRTRVLRARADGASWDDIEAFLLAGLNEQ